MSVAFVREESAEAAQEVSLPLRAISAHPNLVAQSGLCALERALADSQQALKAAQAIADSNDRRRALELTARDVRYFAERVASAVPQPEPGHTVVVAFGCHVTILRDDDRRQTFRIVGEDEADTGSGSIAFVSPLARLLIGKWVGEAVELDGREIEVVTIDLERRFRPGRRELVGQGSRTKSGLSCPSGPVLATMPQGIHRARIA
jgi:transcription elongation GreA/GreB family factor